MEQLTLKASFLMVKGIWNAAFIVFMTRDTSSLFEIFSNKIINSPPPILATVSEV
jgi:hypothetical protein